MKIIIAGSAATVHLFLRPLYKRTRSQSVSQSHCWCNINVKQSAVMRWTCRDAIKRKNCRLPAYIPIELFDSGPTWIMSHHQAPDDDSARWKVLNGLLNLFRAPFYVGKQKKDLFVINIFLSSLLKTEALNWSSLQECSLFAFQFVIAQS